MKNLKFLLITILFFSTISIFAQQNVVLKLSQAPELEATLTNMDTTIILGNSINVGAGLTVTGGSGVYTYNWTGDNSISDPVLKSPIASPADTTVYNCTVMDENGCTFDVEYKVSVIFPIEVISIKNNISCNGESDGGILLNITKGAKPYSVLWSNGETSNEINELGSGDYMLLVTDAEGQSFNDTIKILEPEVLTPVFEIRDTMINDIRMKLIDVTVDGGTFPYYFNWSNSLITEDIVIPDSTAKYSVLISDSKNCMDSLFFDVTYSNSNKLADNLDMNVFPNPNNGKFNFNLSGEPALKLDVIITGIDGKRILQKTIKNFSGYYTEEIQLPRVQGAYNLSAKTPNGMVTKRFIIR